MDKIELKVTMEPAQQAAVDMNGEMDSDVGVWMENDG